MIFVRICLLKTQQTQSDFIGISSPYIGEEEKLAVQSVLDSGIIAQGPITAKLEEEFAQYCETKYSVALNSGTAAIHTALACADIGQGDSVITTPFTFMATANPILMQGAKIKFVDIDEITYNIDTNLIEQAYDDSVKAILPVDLFGQPADYTEIRKFAQEHELKIIEDAAQSIGATYQGAKAGSLGDIGCFSLYATKNMMCAEGGMLTTNDEEVVRKAKSFRQHGMVAPYEYEGIGYNYRMTDILASIARTQLTRIEGFNKLRNQNSQQLAENLSDVAGIILPTIKQDRTSSFHQFTIRITKDFCVDRETFMEKLKENGIGSGIYYPKPLHYYDHINKLGFSKGDFPVAEKMAKEVVSLPVNPSVTQEQIDYIANTIREISNGK